MLQQNQKNKTQALAKGEEERESENDVWCIQKRSDINNSMNSLLVDQTEPDAYINGCLLLM